MFTKTDRLQAIYAKLPNIECKRLCQECCGPIPIFPAEAKRLLPVTPPEHVMQDAFPVLWNRETGSCPHLTVAGACGVRLERPIICRLWALVKQMHCPWGCVPDRWLTDEESNALMREVEAL